MFRLLGILTVGNLLFGGGHHRRSLRRGLLFGALLGYLANKDFDMDRVQKEARDAARKARKTAHKAARAVREEIRNARKAAHDRQIAEHLDRIRAEAEARKTEREARRAEKDTEKAETTNQFPALPQSGTREAQVIRELAEKESCIIVGRCADYVLRQNPRCVSVFINADPEIRVKRMMKEGADEDEVRALIAKGDKKRAEYYNYYTFKKWGDSASYDLCIDSGRFDCAAAVKDVIIDYLKRRFPSTF